MAHTKAERSFVAHIIFAILCVSASIVFVFMNKVDVGIYLLLLGILNIFVANTIDIKEVNENED